MHIDKTRCAKHVFVAILLILTGYLQKFLIHFECYNESLMMQWMTNMCDPTLELACIHMCIHMYMSASQSTCILYESCGYSEQEQRMSLSVTSHLHTIDSLAKSACTTITGTQT
jgi:hypothetical protein